MKDANLTDAPIARMADGSIDFACYDRKARRLRSAVYRRALAAGAGPASLGLFGPTWTLASGDSRRNSG